MKKIIFSVINIAFIIVGVYSLFAAVFEHNKTFAVIQVTVAVANILANTLSLSLRLFKTTNI